MYVMLTLLCAVASAGVACSSVDLNISECGSCAILASLRLSCCGCWLLRFNFLKKAIPNPIWFDPLLDPQQPGSKQWHWVDPFNFYYRLGIPSTDHMQDHG